MAIMSTLNACWSTLALHEHCWIDLILFLVFAALLPHLLTLLHYSSRFSCPTHRFRALNNHLILYMDTIRTFLFLLFMLKLFLLKHFFFTQETIQHLLIAFFGLFRLLSALNFYLCFKTSNL